MKEKNKENTRNKEKKKRWLKTQESRNFRNKMTLSAELSSRSGEDYYPV